MTKNTEKKTITNEYGFYSRVLKEPFDTIEELAEAEEAYYAKLKAKEDAAAQKKADATKVEEAFKALNAARKVYKEERATLTKEYSEALADLKKAFEAGVADIHNTLAAAEETYSSALKEFTDKYQQYHITLKDGDFETTISSSQSKMSNDKLEADRKVVSDLFSLLFGAL